MVFSAVSMAETDSIVVSTSLLSDAVEEVIPENIDLDITVLLPPASCPGHFDLSPRVVPALHAASIIVRHDYQEVIEGKIKNLTDRSLIIKVVSTEASPLIPQNFFELAAEMSQILITQYPGSKREIKTNLADLKTRIDTTEKNINTLKNKWAGEKVICATHVSELCGWLGLNCIGILKRPEETTPADLAALVRLDADLIIANLQEGDQTAISLGKKMNIPVIVMSNFPDIKGYGKSYLDLINENVSRLDNVWQKQ
jgi:zinc transport system substrate-binding protein